MYASHIIQVFTYLVYRDIAVELFQLSFVSFQEPTVILGYLPGLNMASTQQIMTLHA